jgi:protein-disulfide isomerase
VYASRVSADLVSGMRSGVTATPTFFINGARQAGSVRFETLLAAVRSAAQH